MIGEGQLIPDMLYRSDVEPLAVARRAYIVNMIVHTEASLVFALLGGGQSAYVAPVVIAQEDNHIIRHLEPLVVITLHLLI